MAKIKGATVVDTERCKGCNLFRKAMLTQKGAF